MTPGLRPLLAALSLHRGSSLPAEPPEDSGWTRSWFPVALSDLYGAEGVRRRGGGSTGACEQCPQDLPRLGHPSASEGWGGRLCEVGVLLAARFTPQAASPCSGECGTQGGARGRRRNARQGPAGPGLLRAAESCASSKWAPGGPCSPLPAPRSPLPALPSPLPPPCSPLLAPPSLFPAPPSLFPPPCSPLSPLPSPRWPSLSERLSGFVLWRRRMPIHLRQILLFHGGPSGRSVCR